MSAPLLTDSPSTRAHSSMPVLALSFDLPARPPLRAPSHLPRRALAVAALLSWHAHTGLLLWPACVHRPRARARSYWDEHLPRCLVLDARSANSGLVTSLLTHHPAGPERSSRIGLGACPGGLGIPLSAPLRSDYPSPRRRDPLTAFPRFPELSLVVVLDRSSTGTAATAINGGDSYEGSPSAFLGNSDPESQHAIGRPQFGLVRDACSGLAGTTSPFLARYPLARTTWIMINPASGVNPEHLNYFKFIGCCLGLGIFHRCFLDAYSIVRIWRAWTWNRTGITWMLENGITDIIDETFTTVEERFGELVTIELKPGSADVEVTEENKEDVEAVIEYRIQKRVKEQFDAFISGFGELIPQELVNVFGKRELELWIGGMSEINVDDWTRFTDYRGYELNNSHSCPHS
ncbi:hypothetical protein FRC08_017504 [Ceratobasidium sp. 394]|nr:hypothetical protein FRC08_017504 [Ceratobasidium sp. 394]